MPVDVAGATVGWRAWAVRGDADPRLTSLVQGTDWVPHVELVARCSAGSHASPDAQCGCGIYAARDIALLGDVTPFLYVFGCVAVRGDVLEATRGWRASRARPLVLFVDPRLGTEVGPTLAETYGVPAHPVPFGFRGALCGVDPYGRRGLSATVSRAAESLRHHLERRAGGHAAADDGTTNTLATDFVSSLEEEGGRRRRQEAEIERRREQERERIRRDPRLRLLERAFRENYNWWGGPLSVHPRERRADFDAFAKVAFLPDWRHVQVGEIRAGEVVLIAYDGQRWAQATPGEQQGRPSGGLEIGVRFHPAGKDHRYGPGGSSMLLPVPAGTSKIELWFRKNHDWDSRHGQNYWFDVV